MATFLLVLLSLLFITATHADLSRNPIVALLPRHLVAFYPLLSDSKDYAPNGFPNGYTQDGYSRSTHSITPKLGVRLEPGEGVDFPVNVHSRRFPQLTMGGWVQAGAAMEVNRGMDRVLDEQCVSMKGSGKWQVNWLQLK
ncbi:hypothetical protein PHMEG_0002649 [Phytophthora megakarya]|uniref:RxLR effector protein n=1 Tax=Phytophthora megakarya TaxID=4795 RepID=A0A225WXV8_9STRA|nr:hypothetical protein PHMEG_0002649 [Phytophthora megakarya]